MNIKRSHIRFIIILVGFSAVSGQILFLREMMTIFHGNELSLGIVLAVWLLWTGTGSILSGKLMDRFRPIRSLTGLLVVLLGVSVPATILLVRFSQPLVQTVTGEIPGLGMLVLISLAVLSVFCFLSGALFAFTGRLYRTTQNLGIAESVSAVYLWEVLGSGIGGLLMSILLIPFFSPMHIAVAIGSANVIGGYHLMIKQEMIRKGFTRIIVFILLTGCIVISGRLDRYSIDRQWHGFHVVKQVQSRYGVLTVARFSEMLVLYQNGVPVAGYPEQQTIEERIHFALLAHPEPEAVLLVGGGLSGAIPECLKYASLKQLDYVEMDPAMITLGKTCFAEPWQGIEDNPLVQTISQDGRFYTRHCKSAYDVVIVTVPEPSTAQLNRFYTLEYFKEVKRKLKPGGILAIQLTGSENYISEALQNMLQCINLTLRSTFRHVYMIPGSIIYVYATDDSLANLNSDHFINEVKERDILTEYVREYYIPFRFMPDRIDELLRVSEPVKDTPLNTDLRPIAYYLSFIFWGSQFSHWYALWKPGIVQGVVFLVFILIVSILFFQNRRKQPGSENVARIAGSAVLVMGFSVMTCELILLMAFEALYGYIYYQLSILISSFMLGMGGGTFVASKKKKVGIQDLSVIHLALAVIPFMLILIFQLSRFTVIFQWGPFAVFPLITVISGFAGGFQFPIASHIYHTSGEKQNQGLLYGLDLVGGFFGALLVGSVLIPVLGFWKIAMITAVLNGMISIRLLVHRKSVSTDVTLPRTQMPRT